VSLTPRLVGVAGVMARHGGRAAAVAIASEAREWLRDPANEPARAKAAAGLREVAGRAGGGAQRAADLLTNELGRRRSRAVDWERELLRRRYAAVDAAPGPARERALASYVVQAELAPRIVDADPDRAVARRRVLGAIGAEERMLRRERISAGDRELGLGALSRARTHVAEGRR
jgi:hypothetical protein